MSASIYCEMYGPAEWYVYGQHFVRICVANVEYVPRFDIFLEDLLKLLVPLDSIDYTSIRFPVGNCRVGTVQFISLLVRRP